MGVTLEEIARNVGVGTSAVAMALKQKETKNNIDFIELRPLAHRILKKSLFPIKPEVMPFI
jgi:tRNA1(Val) A37 N6-methylase TrmN6